MVEFQKQNINSMEFSGRMISLLVENWIDLDAPRVTFIRFLSFVLNGSEFLVARRWGRDIKPGNILLNTRGPGNGSTHDLQYRFCLITRRPPPYRRNAASKKLRAGVPSPSLPTSILTLPESRLAPLCSATSPVGNPRCPNDSSRKHHPGPMGPTSADPAFWFELVTRQMI